MEGAKLKDIQQEKPVCYCGRCMGEVYQGECTYLFEGKEICEDCMREELDRLLEKDLKFLASIIGIELRLV